MTTNGGKIDLHLHTLKSDGRRTPTELVQLAHERGVRWMALTDHDTTPGVELGTDSTSGDVHMLGLFLDYADEAFQREMARFREGRIERVHKIVANLKAVGVEI